MDESSVTVDRRTVLRGAAIAGAAVAAAPALAACGSDEPAATDTRPNVSVPSRVDAEGRRRRE